MQKKIIIFFSLLFLIQGCYDDCPDSKGSPFDEEDLTWFDFEVGDTQNYKDNLGDDSLLLICVSRVNNADTVFTPESQCPGEGYLTITHSIEFVLTTSFPHLYDNSLKITMRLENNLKINIDLFFGDEDNFGYYWYHYYYNPFTKSFEDLDSGEVIKLDTFTVAGKEYLDVYLIRYSDSEEIPSNIYYDSLYYNKDGFLKFISSQHDYVLERLP